MLKCTFDFYGLPVSLTDLKAEIEVKEGAKLKDIIAALRRKVPALEGQIIKRGEDRMVDGFTFNIRGHFYVDGFDNDTDLQLKDGDHIALLTMPVGG
jgi:molybdopterin converting factor small subunit